MGEWFKQLPSRIVEFWNKYTAKQKALFLSVAAAVVITLVALFLILNRTKYITLSSFNDTASCAKASALLDEKDSRISDLEREISSLREMCDSQKSEIAELKDKCSEQEEALVAIKGNKGIFDLGKR